MYKWLNTIDYIHSQMSIHMTIYKWLYTQSNDDTSWLCINDYIQLTTYTVTMTIQLIIYKWLYTIDFIPSQMSIQMTIYKCVYAIDYIHSQMNIQLTIYIVKWSMYELVIYIVKWHIQLTIYI